MLDRQLKAHDIVRDLQKWLDEANVGHCEDYATELTAEMKAWCGIIVISIGEIDVYCSEYHDEADMTFDFCMREFVGICEQMQRFTKGDSNAGN